VHPVQLADRLVHDQQIGEELEQQRTTQESQLHRQRGELSQLRADKTSLHNQLGREEARMSDAEQRSKKIGEELLELARQVQNDHAQIEQATQLLSQAGEQVSTFEQRRDNLLKERDSLQDNISTQREAVNQIRDRQYQKKLQKQRIESGIEAVREHLGRIQQQFDATNQRLAQINEALTESGDPVDDLTTRLTTMLDQRVSSEKLFAQARDEMAEIENGIAGLEQNRTRQQQQVNEARETLEQHNLQKQEVLVRKQTQIEHVDEMGFDREAVMSEMPENAIISDWQQSLETIQGKIGRIGPVNLVAIEEYEEESTRKEYLDTQHADLTEALETLESVIRKIDRETRSRFHETFEKLNAGFNDFFPQLFGGGKADLQLTSDDFLTAGVTVMARPPGKRNSTIHLLSGGEKALTAVALLFALFKLNPAPFCMLDEVDAPLDDANVDRYCNTLKKLCQVSQIVVITHNKITMEAADILVGVTMAEPGVSRLVSVDIDEAVEMAAQ
ncbi:MAG: chromosome segregation protein SMC, partial [bacterium]